MTIPLFCGNAGRSLVIRSQSVPQGRGVDQINHPVPLISKNLQPALDEVFHARS
ncbi:MAG: hypothetical protein V7L31_18145 [Nostoc sp.]|uniref:hypothetical protein n=1 Tax=Nostoc sp. TaxID=1180 RepID=UPI002FF3D09A